MLKKIIWVFENPDESFQQKQNKSFSKTQIWFYLFFKSFKFKQVRNFQRSFSLEKKSRLLLQLFFNWEITNFSLLIWFYYIGNVSSSFSCECAARSWFEPFPEVQANLDKYKLNLFLFIILDIIRLKVGVLFASFF